MRRVGLKVPVVLVVATIAAMVAATGRASAGSTPPWLKIAQGQTLNRVFGGVKPIRVHYIWYPRKVAVIFEFNRVVVCLPCHAPRNAARPRGRVIRVSYDRRTHAKHGGMRFCESRDRWPLRAWCLRR